MATEIVEQTQQAWAQTLEYLLEIGRTRGFLTYNEILEALPQPEHHIADVDQLYASLQAEGIRVVETPIDIHDNGSTGDDELLTDMPDLTDVALDDPVRMYLQEIGQVPLLSAEQEVMLAKAMEAGHRARRALEREEYSSWQERMMYEQQVAQGNEARQHLIQANLRLVVSIAKKYNIVWANDDGPGAGGQYRSHARGRKVRLYQRTQILHICYMVDPSGDHPRYCRSEPYHSSASAYG